MRCITFYLASSVELKEWINGHVSRTHTRDQLIDVAEKLFLAHGIERVSLRTIVKASGQKNQSVLQYHFGGRDGLITAILDRRNSELEARRRTLLNQALNSETEVDLRAVCAILCRAIFAP